MYISIFEVSSIPPLYPIKVDPLYTYVLGTLLLV